MLKPKKVRYSTRGGYSVEWHEPFSVRLSYRQARALLIQILSEVPNDTFMKEFNEDERQVIRRYEELQQMSMAEKTDVVNKINNIHTIERKIQESITFWMECAVYEPVVYQKHYFGWDEPSPGELVSKEFRNWINRQDLNVAHFERMIASLGLPGSLTMKQLEKRFGEFNPETGKFARGW